MSKSRSLALILSCLAFVLVTGGISWWLLRGGPPSTWHSAPDTVRPWTVDHWNDVHTASMGEFPTGPPELDRLDTITWADDKLKLSYPTVHDGFVWPTEIIQLGEDTPFSDGTRQARVTWLGLARPDAADPDPSDSGLRAAYRFFAPSSHEPLNDAQIKDLTQHYRNQRAYFQVSNNGPDFAIGLQVDGYDHPRWSSFTVYDARTHVQLNSGCSYSVTDDGRFSGSTNLKLWHPCPVLVGLDLLHGPVFEAAVPLKKDTVVELGDARMRIIDVREAPGSRSWSSSGGNPLKEIAISTADTDELVTYLVVEMWPVEQFRGLNWDICSWDGRRIHLNTQTSNEEAIGVFGIAAPMKDLATVRVTLRTRRTRFLVDLREVPGLPEENRGADNLFDVSVPWFGEPRSDWDYRRLLADLVQLEESSSTHGRPPLPLTSPPPGSTPADLARRWEASAPDAPIAIDQAAGEIHFGKPPKAPGVLQRLRDWLRRIGP